MQLRCVECLISRQDLAT